MFCVRDYADLIDTDIDDDDDDDGGTAGDHYLA